MDPPIALTDEDRAILALEGDTIAGHTCKVVVLGEGPPGLDAIRERVGDRIEGAPALTRKLGGSADAPAWVRDESFDLDRHVGPRTPVVPVPRESLPEVVAELFERHLDRDLPLWRMDLVELEDGEVALVWRIHHALADGTAAMRFSRQLLWDPLPGDAQPPPSRAAGSADDERRRAHLAGFIEREFARSRDASPFDGTIGRRRRIAFASVPLGSLHDAAKALGGATLNDAVLAGVAGGLRRWVEDHHGSLGSLRVKVPVSLHHEGDDAGNRDSFFSLALPLNEPDPVERLRAVQAATAVRKADHDADEMDALLRELSRASPHLESLCERLQASPRRFALNVSNVPGPRTPVTVLGASVRPLHSIAEIGEHHALRVSVVSLADELHFGFCADPAIVDGLETFARGVEIDSAALVAAAG